MTEDTELEFPKTDSIYARLIKAKELIGPIAKKESSPGVPFNFRGIDTVTNETRPILDRCGIIVLPDALEYVEETYPTSKGTTHNVKVHVRFHFWAADGSHAEATTWGESSDTADRATAQAHSVALRIALLQAFLIPTSDPDPENEKLDRLQEQAEDQPPPATEEEEQSAKDRGFDSVEAMALFWNELRQASRDLADGEAKSHIREWVKAAGIGFDTFDHLTYTIWDEMLSHINKGGTWKKGYEVPANEVTNQTTNNEEQ